MHGPDKRRGLRASGLWVRPRPQGCHYLGVAEGKVTAGGFGCIVWDGWCTHGANVVFWAVQGLLSAPMGLVVEQVRQLVVFLGKAFSTSLSELLAQSIPQNSPGKVTGSLNERV